MDPPKEKLRLDLGRGAGSLDQTRDEEEERGNAAPKKCREEATVHSGETQLFQQTPCKQQGFFWEVGKLHHMNVVALSRCQYWCMLSYRAPGLTRASGFMKQIMIAELGNEGFKH